MKTPFKPEPLPLKEINWADLVNLVGKANSALAHYNGRLDAIPNPAIFLSPLLTQEAVLSSKIEGTQATLEEVLEFEADPKPTQKYEDIEEILNYRKSLSFAEGELQKRPLCLNLIKDMHSILLSGVRGQNKSRGEFRRTQNWIGRPSTSIDEAEYIPPSPDMMLDCLSNWEKYCHYDEKDALVQSAIIHAQFELIHPFLDGNGRIGRILIPIFLYDKKILSSPMFYISAYFESTRDQYYNRLLAISKNHDWLGWIDYFLHAIIEQSQKNSQKARDIMSLYESMKTTIADLTHSRYAIQILDFLFISPIFNSKAFAASSQIPKPSVARILNTLENGGVIETISQSKGRRPTVYIFPQLINIVET